MKFFRIAIGGAETSPGGFVLRFLSGKNSMPLPNLSTTPFDGSQGHGNTKIAYGWKIA